MYKGLLDLHNLLRWAVLITALYAVIKSLSGIASKKSFSKSDKRAALFYMISCDLQLLIGLALYITQKWYLVLTAPGTMKNNVQRFFSMEHEVGMLIAIILVHLGYNTVKKNIADATKFKRMFWFSLLSLVIIIAMIPWPFREGIARSWFPGM